MCFQKGVAIAAVRGPLGTAYKNRPFQWHVPCNENGQEKRYRNGPVFLSKPKAVGAALLAARF